MAVLSGWSLLRNTFTRAMTRDLPLHSLSPMRTVALILGATWLTLYLAAVLLVLNWRVEHQIRVTGHPFAISDLFPRWLGARALLQGIDPYSPAFNDQLQLAYYGTLMSPERQSELFRTICEFFYPPFVVLPLLPLLHLPFELVRVVATVALGAALVLTYVLWSRLQGGRERPRLSWLFTLLFLPSLDLLLLQQLTALVLLYLTGGYYLAAKGRLRVAGAILALGLIKPQLALLPAAALLFWALWRRERWALLGSFGVVSLEQAAVSELLVPGWIPKFVDATLRYNAYNTIGYWLPELVAGDRLTGLLLIVAPTVALTVYSLWTTRLANLTSHAMLRTWSFSCAATLVIVPDISLYNKTLLIVPLVTLFSSVARGPVSRLALKFVWGVAATPFVVLPAALLAWLIPSLHVSAIANTANSLAHLSSLLLPLLVISSFLLTHAAPKGEKTKDAALSRRHSSQPRLLQVAA